MVDKTPVAFCAIIRDMTVLIAPDYSHSGFDAMAKYVPLLMLCFFAIFIVIAVLAYRVRLRRRQQMAQWALESGFEYSLVPSGEVLDQLRQLRPGLGGMISPARFVNALRGTVGGLPCLIGDRWVSSGKSSSCTTLLALIFPAPLPHFTVCRENLFLKLADKLGYHDINFPGAPEFSRRYFLHGNSAEEVQALFTPEVLQAFEQLDPAFQYTVHADGQFLMLYRYGRQIPVPELRSLRDAAEMLAGAFHSARAGSAFH